MCIPLTQCEAQANWPYYWSSQTLPSDGFQMSESQPSKCELVTKASFIVSVGENKHHQRQIV